MSTATLTPKRAHPIPLSGSMLAALMLTLAVCAALHAGWTPIAFSIATVFLFAGPHNWFEARYILGRLPARAGKLWPFFLLSFIGIVGLTVLFASLPWWAQFFGGYDGFLTAVASWNSLLLIWIAVLVHMRSRQNPRQDWGWIWPLTFLLLAGTWMEPFWFSIATVYLHPLMSLWILDRELARSRPHWRRPYHVCLAAIPILAGVLIWRLRNSPSLPGDDALTLAITNHAGAWVFENLSTHLLVAMHTFLEMIHYGVWLIAIPLIGLRSLPWNLDTIPAAKRSMSWRRGIALLLMFGLFISVVMWVCFLVDYPTTRHIYFTVALVHVLAEIPFLLRAL